MFTSTYNFVKVLPAPHMLFHLHASLTASPFIFYYLFRVPLCSTQMFAEITEYKNQHGSKRASGGGGGSEKGGILGERIYPAGSFCKTDKS